MNDMDNLLAETIAKLAAHGRTPDDVRFVRSTNFEPGYWRNNQTLRAEWATWAEFAVRADLEYDAGFGGNVITQQLMIVGDDWWLERHEYDGSEWWEYKSLPSKPDTHSPAIRLKYADD